ncbi:MAG TPA: AI-2E family transporter [Candidatus Limnocylindrales bacterium]|nr:AI-2E family transporter [Candidatus Limnocylindrales bacterium]
MTGITPWITRGAGLALGASLVIGALAAAWAAGSVLLLIFIAVILASGLQPIVAWIRTHVPIGRGAAILVVYGVFLLVVVGMAVVILPAAVGQLERVIASLPPFFDQARQWAAEIRPVALSDAMTKVIDAAARAILPSDPSPDGEVVVQVGIGVVGAIISVLTVLTVVYFWLTEHARLQRYALAFIPQHRRARARDVWNQAETRLGMWVRGQLILMGAIGVATGIAYTVLGVPAAVLLGLAAAIAEAIPIVGPLLGAIPAVLVAATVSPELAVTVAVVYAVLQFVEGNVLVPIVMRNTVGISPFLVIFSVLAGAAAGGFVGALLAVPIAATAEILLEGLQAREVPVAQDPTAGESTAAAAADASASNAPGDPDVQLGDVVADGGAPPR